MAFGAAEDVVRAPDLVSAKAEMTLFRLAGFSAIRVTSQWLPGQVAPTESELTILRNVSAAAQLSGVKVYLSVYPPGSRSTPLTPEAREEFAAYLTVLAQQLPSIDDVIVGNEPNLNRFWLPQFNPGRVECGFGRVPRAARTFLRCAQGGRPGNACLGRRSGAARHRPARNRP